MWETIVNIYQKWKSAIQINSDNMTINDYLSYLNYYKMSDCGMIHYIFNFVNHYLNYYKMSYCGMIHYIFNFVNVE